MNRRLASFVLFVLGMAICPASASADMLHELAVDFTPSVSPVLDTGSACWLGSSDMPLRLVDQTQGNSTATGLMAEIQRVVHTHDGQPDGEPTLPVEQPAIQQLPLSSSGSMTASPGIGSVDPPPAHHVHQQIELSAFPLSFRLTEETGFPPGPQCSGLFRPPRTV